MYIWKTVSLADDIKNNAVEQNEWKKYYLTMSIFMTLVMYLTALSPRGDLAVVLIEAITVTGIVIYGVNFTYQSNNGDIGVDYIPRMTALSLPILVKLFLLSLFIGVLTGILSEVFLLSAVIIDWFMAGCVAVIQAIFFWRISIHLKYINA